MADSVHSLLEDMVPELDDFSKRDIFADKEIKAIVKQRTNFEYNLARKVTEKSDYLKFIQYELNLNTLRVARKRRLGITRNNLPSDHSMIRRLHFIFNRMLKKFSGDRRLWLQYFDFCQKSESFSVLGKAYARAVSAIPRETVFWIEAAKHEFEHNSNIKAARTLLQRAIRLNQNSKELWIEYFRLEMLYTEKIRLRRNLLNRKVITKCDFEEEIGKDDGNEETETNDFLNYKIPKIVYENALKEFPNDVGFRLKFANIYQLFPNSEEAELQIYNDIQNNENLLNKEETYDVLAQRYMSKGLDEEVLLKICEVYEEGFQALPTKCMVDYYINFLFNVMENDNPLNGTVVSGIFRSVICDLIIGTGKRAANEMILSLLSVEKVTKAMTLKGLYTDAQSLIESMRSENMYNVDYWLFSIRFNINFQNKKDFKMSKESILQTIDQSIHIHPNSFELWKLKLEYIIVMNPEETENTFKESIKKNMTCYATQHQLNGYYLDWTMLNKGLEACRVLYEKIISNGTALHLFDFILKCIEMEENQIMNPSLKHIRQLYEKAISSSPQNLEMYVKYIKSLRRLNNFSAANNVYKRAEKVFGPSCIELEQQLLLI